MNFDTITNKPFFVKNITWTSTDVRYTELDVIKIPSDIINNLLAKRPFESSALYRTKLCILAQISGTPMHSGTLLLSAEPLGMKDHFPLTPAILEIPSKMSSPHAFLSANEASSVCLEVPFYSGTEFIRTEVSRDVANFNTFNYAEVSITVLNPLGVPTSGSSSLTISIHAMFEESEFFVPNAEPDYVANSKIIDQTFDFIKERTADVLDTVRGTIRAYTGLHNPNVTAPSLRVVTGPNMINTTDKPIFLESLTPFTDFERRGDPLPFRTYVDEMSLKHIFSKPMYLGTFSVSQSTAVGKVVWSRPITPFQSNVFSSEGDRVLFNPLEQLAHLSSHWSGKLKIHIQSSMSNFHYCKLMVAKVYKPVLEQAFNVPAFSDVHNFLTDTLEFSSGGQVQTVSLPFFAPIKMLSSTPDFTTNAFMHGVYYIYLMQPLVSNGSVTTSVEFNVFLTADEDFSLYGFGPDCSQSITNSIPSPSLLVAEDYQAESSENCEGSAKAPVLISDNCNLMNKAALPESSNFIDDSMLRPLISIRDFSRRMVPVANLSLVTSSTGSSGFVSLGVSDLLGFSPLPGSSPNNNLNDTNIPSVLSGLFRGFTGSAKFRIVSNLNITLNVFYIPPHMRCNLDPNLFQAMQGASSFSSGSTPLDAAANSFIRVQTSAEITASNSNTLTSTPFKLLPDHVHPNLGNNTQFYDFTVPNMSSMKYIGDLNLRGNHSSGKTENYADSLGTIVISGDTTGTTATTVPIKVYVGTTDESRYGCQSVCLPRILEPVTANFPTAVDPPENFMLTMYSLRKPTTLLNPTIPLLENEVPACYITN